MYRRNFVKAGLAGIGTLAFSKTVGAAIQASEKKNWAVVYGTQCGSTKDAAEAINEGLGDIADVIDVTTSPNVSDYEFFIIGGWISGGNLIGSVKNFVIDNKAALSAKIMGLYTVCGNGGQPVGDKQINDLLTKQIVQFSGVSDKPAKLFNGRSDPACNGMSFNYDLFSKEECVTFGEQILTTAARTVPHKIPARYALQQSYFNPLHPVTPIGYQIPVESTVRLTVSSLDGRKVATLVSEHQKAGNYSANWDARGMAPGFYLYRLEAGAFSTTKKLRVFH
jgi:flavodoxin